MIKSRSLRSISTLIAKLVIIAVLFFSGTYVFQLVTNLHMTKYGMVANVDADNPINVWWPTDNAKVSDTQTFKAMIQDKSVSDYDMFWSVDGGQQVKMYDSSTDYPHKEAVVDLTNWNWHGTGPYKLTFSAVDHSGNSLGSRDITIYTPGPAQGPTTVEAGSATTSTTASIVASIAGVQIANADTGTSTSNASTTQSTAQPMIASTMQSASQPTVSTASQVSNVNVWWPTQGASMQGTQPFKAVIDGMSLDKYTMYWQVDGGVLNKMNDNQTDYPHKEASVDLSSWTWRGNGPYVVSFIAKGLDNTTFAQANITIYNSGFTGSATTQPIQTTQTTTQTQTPVTQTTTATPVPTVTQTTTSAGNPFSGTSFFLDVNNDAKKLADSVRSSNPSEAYQLDKIGNTPTTVWLGGWNSDVGGYLKQVVSAAKSQGSMPTFVLYNIPGRDCSQYSAGGATSGDSYRSWISQIASALGSDNAAFIVEPDGIALTSCLSQSQISERFSLMQYAVSTLKSKPHAHVYIDAGHPNWLSADDMASRLNQAGISQADGFALNTSNFFTTQSNIDYGSQISSKVGGKHFVIDTGRNGLGPTADNQWCNPPGRALGAKPTANTGNSLVDAYLWVKGPGGSDGNCNGGPNAGVFWPSYAIDMAERSAY